MCVLSVFSLSGAPHMPDGAMDVLGRAALRELMVLPTWPLTGLWIRMVMGGVGVLGIHTATVCLRVRRSRTR